VPISLLSEWHKRTDDARSVVRRTGAAAEVLQVGDLPIPEPGPGEVRLRVIASGLNPTDVKSRVRPGSMPAPRVIPAISA